MKLLRIFLMSFALILLALPVCAQLSNGTVKGVVTDPSGGSVPGAAIELINTGTNETRQQKTAPDGNYSFVALPPGEYELKVNSSGFAAWTGTLTLRVAQTAVVNVPLLTAAVSTSVQISDVTPIINAEVSSIADVKEAARISSLPLQSRNFLGILNLTPGVVSNSFAGQGAGYTRINGLRGGSVDYMVDGMSASERYTNELQRLPQPIPSIQELKVSTTNANAEYSRPGTVEVVTKGGTNEFHGQLFELMQNSAVRAKSFHQQSVNFLVRNEFGGNLAGPVWLPKIYNGRNKTFFFADVEGIRERSAGTQRFVMPQANWKGGDFSNYTDDSGNQIRIYDPLSSRIDPATGAAIRQPFTGNRIPENRINAIGKKVVGYLPDPNVNIPYYEGQNYQRPNAGVSDDNTLMTFKGDQLFGAHRLAVRYTHVDKNRLSPGYLLNDTNGLQSGHNAAVSFTALVKPNMINELRAGVQRFHAYRGPIQISPAITETLGLPTYPGTVAWPSFYFGDSWTPNGYFEGIDRENPQDAPMLTTNLADNFSWTKGKHEMKFGFFFQRNAVNTFETGQPGGDYNFSGLFTAQQNIAAAGTGIFDQATVNTGAGLADLLMGYVDFSGLNQYPRFYTRQNQFSLFAQDNWRVSRRLTLNVGLRYDYWTPFSDKRDQATTLNLNAAGGPIVTYAGASPITKQGFPQNVVDAYMAAGLRFQSATEANFPSSLWNMSKNNFAPRIGGAFQINEKTVVRGAYGIYYWAMPLVQYHQNTRKNPPFSYSFQSLVDDNNNNAAELLFPVGGPDYANQSPDARTLGKAFITPNALNITKGNGWNILPWDPNYRPQMAQEWNFTIERVLPGRFGSRVSYVGTKGTHLEVYDPINFTIPRKQAPGATPAERRAYPDFATSSTNAMDLLRFNGYSNSQQLQTEIKRNFANGFVFQGFYTFQKTLTNSEGSNNSYGGLEMLPGALTNNASVDSRLRSIYANDGGLPRHNFSVNASYELPFGKGKPFLSSANGFVQRLVGGWNATGFYYWRSGLFFSPYYNVRGSNTILAPGKTGILPTDQRQAARWFDASINRADLGQPYNGETFIRRADQLDNDLLNNIPRNYMTGPGFYNVDASFFKVTDIAERFRLRIEAQIFNLLNHKNFDLPNTAGIINTGIGLPRLVQFQARFEF